MLIRFFLLVFISTISLYALSDKEILDRADTLSKSSLKSKQFRAYNDYKNLYLRSIMAENDKYKRYAVKGIIKTGKYLHIDVSSYYKELKTKHTTNTTTKKYKHPTYIKTTKKHKNLRINASNKLQSIKMKGNYLILDFKNTLGSKQVNFFTIYDKKKKVYKYVFDVIASMLDKSRNIVKNNVDRIQLAQYKINTIRLVIQNSSRLKVRYKKNKDKLKISIIPVVVKNKISKKSSSFKSVNNNKIIVIDPGHGGKDPGAIGYKKTKEKNIVLSIAKKLKYILNNRGYKVYMTRDSNRFIKLSNRTKYANKKRADLFISIHANSIEQSKKNKASGIECYFLSPSRSNRAKRVAAKENSADMSDMNRYAKKSFLNILNSHKIIASNKLAIDLQAGMLTSLRKSYKNIKDAGVREGPFWVLVGAQMPSVLIEVGFISNPNEAKRLLSSKYQKNMAIGIANGVQRYFKYN